MAEIFSGIASVSLWLVILILALAYVVIVGGLRAFLRPALVGNLDPLNITLLLFTGPAIIGLILTPFLIDSASQSYFLILLFMSVLFLIIRFAGKPRKVDLSDRMDVDFQVTLLFFTMLIIIANVTVNMIIPGKIPLLTEGGSASRFDATENSRLLTWLSLGTGPVAGLIFAVTQNIRVRKFALIAVVLIVGQSLLFASKGSILTIVFILLNSSFIARARNDRERYRKLRRALISSIVIVTLIVPFYLSFILASGGMGVVGGLTVRFLGGFDQLIYASQSDLLRPAGIDSLMKVDIFDYQLMPFVKAVFSTKYDYSSVGQYVVEAATGTYIEGPFTLPNSNLILETILTSGKYLGFVFFILELSGFYWCRRVVLRRPITPFSLVLVQAVILTPVGLFYSGQEWVTETILLFFIVVAALFLSKLWRSILWLLRMQPVPDIVRSR